MQLKVRWSKMNPSLQITVWLKAGETEICDLYPLMSYRCIYDLCPLRSYK